MTMVLKIKITMISSTFPQREDPLQTRRRGTFFPERVCSAQDSGHGFFQTFRPTQILWGRAKSVHGLYWGS